MPERDGEQGDRIAGQYFYDIYATGGHLLNIILTDATINGLLYAPSARTFTGSGTVTVLNTDNVIFINKTVPAATAVTLPATPAVNQYVIIKDAKGDANTHNITISGNGKTIDGGSTYVIGSPYGAITMMFNGDEWSQTA